MPAIAGAESGYPDRPIQIYVPFAAGSASDVITRILLDRMATFRWAKTSWSKIAPAREATPARPPPRTPRPTAIRW